MEKNDKERKKKTSSKKGKGRKIIFRALCQKRKQQGWSSGENRDGSDAFAFDEGDLVTFS